MNIFHTIAEIFPWTQAYKDRLQREYEREEKRKAAWYAQWEEQSRELRHKEELKEHRFDIRPCAGKPGYEITIKFYNDRYPLMVLPHVYQTEESAWKGAWVYYQGRGGNNG